MKSKKVQFLLLFTMALLIAGCEKSNDKNSNQKENYSKENEDLLPYSFFLSAGYDSSQDKEYIDDFSKSFKEANQEYLQGDKAIIRHDKIWSNKSQGASLNATGDKLIIKVCWEPGGDANTTLDQRGRNLTKTAITNTWQKYAAVEFEGWETTCQANSKGIRILVADTGAPHTLGLGTDIDGRKHGMRLNFNFNNWSSSCASSEAQRDICIHSIAIHEFGHGLGIDHEQTKLFVDGFINLTSGQKAYFKKQCTDIGLQNDGISDWVKNNPENAKKLYWWNQYDPNSVMNYCRNIYSQKVGLSQLDIEAVKKFYGGK